MKGFIFAGLLCLSFSALAEGVGSGQGSAHACCTGAVSSSSDMCKGVICAGLATAKVAPLAGNREQVSDKEGLNSKRQSKQILNKNSIGN